MGIIALETRAHDPENAGRETEQVNVQFLSSVGSSLDETIDIPMATGGGGASLINLICIKFKLKFISKFQRHSTECVKTVPVTRLR
jgi:hypothetical protein